jgi:hypothetical protein
MQTSPDLIDYDGFYVTLKEFADSIRPNKWLSNTVVEVALINITKNLLNDSKKVIMPLRVAVS